MFLQTRECDIIFLKNIFWLDCADVFRSHWYKPCGYQADDLRMSLTSIPFSHVPFSADDLDMPRSDWSSSSALSMYTRVHEHAPKRLRWCISAASR